MNEATSRARGAEIREMVTAGRLDEVETRFRASSSVLRKVRGMLYSEDDLVRERAAEAIGRIAPALGEASTRKLRKLLTELLWTLNDESGMSGRGTPEAVGRIVAALPDLAGEYGPILVSYLEKEEIALNDEIMDGGLLAALGRLGPEVVHLGDAGVARLRDLLRAPEPRLRGTAAWAAGRLGITDLRGDLESLTDDPAPFPLYLEGELREPTVGETAASAVTALA
jgi:HEAT repeat protein